MRDAADVSIIETLHNGRKVEIRAQRSDDGTELMAAIGRMSDESLYRRFLTAKRRFSDEEADTFLNIDFATHAALVAVTAEGGKARIVGAGRYIVIQPGRAEVALAIVDDFQRQGAGAILMRNLIQLAREADLRELVAEVLASNSAMLKIFEKCGLRMSTAREGAMIHVKLTCV